MLKYTLKRAISILQSKISSAADQSQAPDFSERAFESSPDSGSAPHPSGRDQAMDRRTESLRVLELKPGASADDIKKAYRRLCAKYHPDRFANQPEKLQTANDLFTQINAAYDYLQKTGGNAK